MPRTPQAIRGVDFDESFFDRVFRRAGGHRIRDICTPLPGVQNADYLIFGWAIELKILTVDPLQGAERQARLKPFFDEHFPRGYIWITATRQSAALTGQVAQEFWERYLGRQAQDRIDTGAAQVADTKAFLPQVTHGAVMLVNAGAHSLDWQSFFRLCGHYQQRFVALDGVVPFSAVPANTASGYQIHFCTCSKKKEDPEMDHLFETLNAALRAEIEQKTGRTLQVNELQINAPPVRVHFHLSPQDGLIRKA